MAKRETWEGPVARAVLQEGVATKQAHHTERLEHWTGKEHDAEQDLRANGIDLRDAANLGYSNAPSTAYHQEPVLHPEKVAALREAQGKVREHRVAFEGYLRG